MTKQLRGAIRKLARKIAKMEGKKHEASFGDIEEILKDIATFEASLLKRNKPMQCYPTYTLCEYATAVLKKDSKKKVRKKK